MLLCGDGKITGKLLLCHGKKPLTLSKRAVGQLRIHVVKCLSRLTHWVLEGGLEPYNSELQNMYTLLMNSFHLLLIMIFSTPKFSHCL